MSANRSTAVMQRRHEPDDSLDYFPTPPWATRALCERLELIASIGTQEVWEPACGEGHMALPLGEYFDRVYASDVHDYSAAFAEQASVRDFLIDWNIPPRFERFPPQWIITNPPFRMGEEFIRTALMRAQVGVAVFVRTAFLEGKERHRSLFKPTPPALVLQFVERVPVVKGRLDKEASSATSYCWIVWLKQHPAGARGPAGASHGDAAERAKDFIAQTAFDWIAPCRTRLEQARDYPIAEAELAPAPLFDQASPEGVRCLTGASQSDAAEKGRGAA